MPPIDLDDLAQLRADLELLDQRDLLEELHQDPAPGPAAPVVPAESGAAAPVVRPLPAVPAPRRVEPLGTLLTFVTGVGSSDPDEVRPLHAPRPPVPAARPAVPRPSVPLPVAPRRAPPLPIPSVVPPEDHRPPDAVVPLPTRPPVPGSEVRSTMRPPVARVSPLPSLRPVAAPLPAPVARPAAGLLGWLGG